MLRVVESMGGHAASPGSRSGGGGAASPASGGGSGVVGLTLVPQPKAMTVATVDSAGMPDTRMVLMNAHDSRGFVFFTNFDSRKGEELKAHPVAALIFHWKTQRRQIRARDLNPLARDVGFERLQVISRQ